MEFSSFKILRLNAELFPITRFEQEKYNEHGMPPMAVEAAARGELVEHVRDADAVMVVSQSLPADVIKAMRRCRVICRLGAGTDKIDVAAATELGIVVANVPDFCVEEQADHAFALLLSVARRLNEMRHCMLNARYHDGREQSRPLRRLPGRTLGLVGFGLSARAMARRAAGFGLRVLATRRNMSAVDPEAQSLGVKMVPLEQLLAESDFVSLHLPLNDATRHLFDRETLSKMKPESSLINTARGAIVDEDALAEMLEAGHLAGAGLDTFAVIDVHQPHPTRPTHRLFQMENVVFTPHVAAFSVDSSREVGYGSVANLIAVLSGQWPNADRIVNPQVKPRHPLS
ncbi:MAG: C-terminal binding protein [Planctomycetaceae bacterium]|jgi:D-3-phosphoglycerate dehydrogenase / 2-oxoglutarate reductase|nr:C-terminal binding protein [Planctomycetaceae bacterium]MBT6498048.1 C-terminal binding protein [Planctomycetaceae bacterium]